MLQLKHLAEILLLLLDRWKDGLLRMLFVFQIWCGMQGEAGSSKIRSCQSSQAAGGGETGRGQAEGSHHEGRRNSEGAAGSAAGVPIHPLFLADLTVVVP